MNCNICPKELKFKYNWCEEDIFVYVVLDSSLYFGEHQFYGYLYYNILYWFTRKEIMITVKSFSGINSSYEIVLSVYIANATNTWL